MLLTHALGDLTGLGVGIFVFPLGFPFTIARISDSERLGASRTMTRMSLDRHFPLVIGIGAHYGASHDADRVRRRLHRAQERRPVRTILTADV